MPVSVDVLVILVVRNTALAELTVSSVRTATHLEDLDDHNWKYLLKHAGVCMIVAGHVGACMSGTETEKKCFKLKDSLQLEPHWFMSELVRVESQENGSLD